MNESSATPSALVSAHVGRHVCPAGHTQSHPVFSKLTVATDGDVQVAAVQSNASQHSELVQLLSAQLEVGSDAFTVKPASHELCWKVDDEHEGLASQHSELVQLLSAQLEIGSDAFTVKPASHKLCWKLEDEHEGLASQHSELVQLLSAQLELGSDAFTVKPASHELCWKLDEAHV